MNIGSIIGGFRIERELGRGSLGVVYEATQLSLGRTVALRLIEWDELSEPGAVERLRAQQRRAAAFNHPHAVATFEAGEWDRGPFVATRLVRGRTLAELIASGGVRPGGGAAELHGVEAALEAAHRAGIVHGRISAANVLVDDDGVAYLSDLGLGRAGTAADDVRRLGELIGAAERARTPRRRLGVAFAVAVALILLAVAVVAFGGEAEPEPASLAAPPVAAGVTAFGSDLAPGPVRALGCAADPGPNTPACTIGQTTAGGLPARVPSAGVIRAWAVRGAGGDVTLQVIGGRRGAFLRGFSQVESVAGPGPHSFATAVAVERGDRIGLALAPGAVVGLDAAATSNVLRWGGTLDFVPAQPDAERLAGELQLRVDIEVGAQLRLPQLRGRRAARAPSGQELASQVVDLPAGRAVRAELVRVGGAIAIDSVRGASRLARVAVAGADRRGSLLSFQSFCGFRQGICLRWSNPDDGAPVIHAYRLTRSGRGFRPIG